MGQVFFSLIYIFCMLSHHRVYGMVQLPCSSLLNDIICVISFNCNGENLCFSISIGKASKLASSSILCYFQNRKSDVFYQFQQGKEFACLTDVGQGDNREEKTKKRKTQERLEYTQKQKNLRLRKSDFFDSLITSLNSLAI